MGVVSTVIIGRWAIMLCRDTAWELLDGHPTHIDPKLVRDLFRQEKAEVLDVHIWTIAPKTYACELVVGTPVARGPEYYRSRIEQEFKFDHVVIEERVTS